MRKAASSACNSNNCPSALPGDGHQTPVHNRHALRVLPISSHRILRRHIHKDQELIKLTIIAASSITFLSEKQIF